ncbi:hypothetical protein GCM10027051_18260 [Niabella terrae]
MAATVLLALIGLSACTNPRYIHSPAVQNAAFFQQQGDFKFSVAAAGNPGKIFSNLDALDEEDDDDNLDHSYGFDGQAAVAVTDHFFIAAGGYYRNEKDRYHDDDLPGFEGPSKVNYERSMFDIHAGFYTPMGNSRKAYFNGSLGVGFGSMRSTDNGDPVEAARARTYKAQTMKYSLTPAFNFFFNDYLRMAVSPRFSLLKLHDIQTNYSPEEETALGYGNARSKTFALLEPAVLLQAGFKNNDWLKLDMGFNFSSNPFTSDGAESDGVDVDTYNVKSRNFLLSLGLSFYPGRKK